ncbi:MAG: aminopeptidase P family protein [Ahrensia sp.]|nr:aminopeptidase P family protein [Ahrensia sp.]
MFQSFEAPSNPVSGDRRLRKLRRWMRDHELDALVVSHADEQRNEYLPACAERLAWISGFTGSAGEALILHDKAILFVDGRYTLQAADQTDSAHWAIESLVETPVHVWLKRNIEQGAVVGCDPALLTSDEVSNLSKAVESRGGRLRLLAENPIDQVWEDRPAPPDGSVKIHDFEFAGRLSADKLEEMRKAMAEREADLCLLTDPASICWLFNIRGSDVAHTPLVLARAILRREGDPLLYIDPEKLDIEVRAFLTQIAELREPSVYFDDLARLSSHRRVMVDPQRSAHANALAVAEAGGTVIKAMDPAVIPRAVKNDTEIAGTRNAHLRDGSAMASFLAWLDAQEPGSVDEIAAAQTLEQFRADMAGNMPLRDISFDTISGSGPNGAIVHYRVTHDTNRTLQAGELYLTDSGGQYDDGTTDITRTVVIGEPDARQRRSFTLVFKGHIAIATARFPKGTRGVDIDSLARVALWKAGMDYGHGTGHGVGSYLSVHEGPQNISKRGMQTLLPGMILSNEPGYYRTNEFGIRIENLLLVREAMEIDGGDTPMLGFETLTLCPIDQRLIDPILLTDEELHWLNAYHGWVRRELTPLVSNDVADWLHQATEPMIRELPAASA